MSILFILVICFRRHDIEPNEAVIHEELYEVQELPFCKIPLLGKQLISLILFGLSKSGKKTIFYIVVATEKCINYNVSDKADFANYSSKLFADFRKVDLSPKLLEKCLVFFCYIFS